MHKPRKIQAPRPRNWLAVHAQRRKGGVMKDRRAERGGARNWQRDLLSEPPPA